MAYTPPSGDAAAIAIDIGYTPPLGDNIIFTSGDGFILRFNALTENATSNFSFIHYPTVNLSINASTENVAPDFSLLHYPLFFIDIATTTEDSTADFTFRFSPRVTVTIAATTADTVISAAMFHDWSQFVASRPDYFTIYRAYLAAPGQSTAEIPLSSWQASLNFGERNSYVSAVVPSVSTYGEIIAARTGGTLAIHKGYRHAVTGDESTEQLFSIAITAIRLDEGSQNSSCTIEGLATLTWPPAKIVTLSGVTYRRTDADGSLNLRGSVDLRIRPGDTVTYDGASFTVGRLSIQVGVTGENMEITEA